MPVIIPTSSIHHDERYYPEPHTFNPDNIAPDTCKERDSILFMPFGDGPRNCIGIRFAKMQIIGGLAMLLKNFKFTVCELTPIPMVYSKQTFITSPEKDIHLKVTKL